MTSHNNSVAQTLVEIYETLSKGLMSDEDLIKAKKAKGLHQWKKLSHIAHKLQGKHEKHISFTSKNPDGSKTKHNLGSAAGNEKFLLGYANPGFHMSPYHWQVIDPTMSDEEAEERAAQGYHAKSGHWGDDEAFVEGDTDDGTPHKSFGEQPEASPTADQPEQADPSAPTEEASPKTEFQNPHVLDFFNKFNQYLSDNDVDPSSVNKEDLHDHVLNYLSDAEGSQSEQAEESPEGSAPSMPVDEAAQSQPYDDAEPGTAPDAQVPAPAETAPPAEAAPQPQPEEATAAVQQPAAPVEPPPGPAAPVEPSPGPAAAAAPPVPQESPQTAPAPQSDAPPLTEPSQGDAQPAPAPAPAGAAGPAATQTGIAPPQGMVICPFGGGEQCSANGGDGAYWHKMGGSIMLAHASHSASQGKDLQHDAPEPAEWSGKQGHHMDDTFFATPSEGKIYHKGSGKAYDWDLVKDLPKYQQHPHIADAMNKYDPKKYVPAPDHNVPDAVLLHADNAIEHPHHAHETNAFVDDVYPFVGEHFPTPGSVVPMGSIGGEKVFGVVTPESIDFYNEDGEDVSVPLGDGHAAYLDLSQDGETSPKDLVDFAVNKLNVDPDSLPEQGSDEIETDENVPPAEVEGDPSPGVEGVSAEQPPSAEGGLPVGHVSDVEGLSPDKIQAAVEHIKTLSEKAPEAVVKPKDNANWDAHDLAPGMTVKIPDTDMTIVATGLDYYKTPQGDHASGTGKSKPKYHVYSKENGKVTDEAVDSLHDAVAFAYPGSDIEEAEALQLLGLEGQTIPYGVTAEDIVAGNLDNVVDDPAGKYDPATHGAFEDSEESEEVTPSEEKPDVPVASSLSDFHAFAHKEEGTKIGIDSSSLDTFMQWASKTGTPGDSYVLDIPNESLVVVADADGDPWLLDNKKGTAAYLGETELKPLQDVLEPHAKAGFTASVGPHMADYESGDIGDNYHLLPLSSMLSTSPSSDVASKESEEPAPKKELPEYDSTSYDNSYGLAKGEVGMVKNPVMGKYKYATLSEVPGHYKFFADKEGTDVLNVPITGSFAFQKAGKLSDYFDEGHSLHSALEPDTSQSSMSFHEGKGHYSGNWGKLNAPPPGTVVSNGDQHLMFTDHSWSGKMYLYHGDVNDFDWNDPVGSGGHNLGSLNHQKEEFVKKWHGDYTNPVKGVDHPEMGHIDAATPDKPSGFIGETYPSKAPPVGTSWEVSGPFQKYFGYKGKQTLQFAPAGFTHNGKTLPYTAENAEIINSKIEEAIKDPTAVETEVYGKPSDLKEGESGDFLSDNGAFVAKLTTLPIGAQINLSSGTWKQKNFHIGTWLKYGEDEWKKVYASGNKGAAVSFSEIAEKVVNDHYTTKATVTSLPSAEEAAKLAKKAAKKKAKYAKKADGVPSHVTHWDALAHKGLPDKILMMMKGAQDLPQDAHLPKYTPPTGTIVEVESPGLGTDKAYLTFKGNGSVIVAHKYGDGWKVAPPYQTQTFKAAMLYVTGQGSITESSAAKKAGIYGYDFSGKSVSDMLAEKPLQTPTYSPCIHGGGDKCKSHGGTGKMYHADGDIHPLKQFDMDDTAHTESLPPAVTKMYESAKNFEKNTDHPWAPEPGTVKSRTDAQGQTTHLITGSDSLVLVHPDNTKSIISYSDLKAAKGNLSTFKMGDWNLEFKSSLTEMPMGFVPKGLSQQAKKALESAIGHHGTSINDNAVNKFFGDKVKIGHVYAQEREDGTHYLVAGSGSLYHVGPDGEALGGHGYYSYNNEISEHFKKEFKNSEFSDAVPAAQAALDPKIEVHSDPENLPYEIPEVVKEKASYFKTYGSTHSSEVPGFMPPVGTVIESTKFQGHGGSSVYAVVQQNSIGVYTTSGGTAHPAYDLTNKTHLGEAIGAFNLMPEIKVDKKEGNASYYATGVAPQDAPPNVQSAAFSYYGKDTKDLPDITEGLPSVGQLVATQDAGGNSKYVLATPYFTQVWNSDGSKDGNNIWHSKITPTHSEKLKSLGFEVAANYNTGADATSPKMFEPHSVAEHPQVGGLTSTGKSLGGGEHANEVYADAETGDHYLWKPLTPGFHHYVVDAEHVGSKVSAMYLGDGAAFAQAQEHTNGTKGTLQKVLPEGTKVIGKDMGPVKLAEAHGEEAVLQLAGQHPVDWLVSNHDTHGDQFMVTPSGKVVGIDKGQAFKHFGNEDEHLSLNYHPNGDEGPHGPYYYRIHNAIKSGELSIAKDKLYSSIGSTIAKIYNTSDEDLTQAVQPLADAKFSSASAKQKFISDVLTRKNSIKSDFEKFLSDAHGEDVDLSEFIQGHSFLPDADIYHFPKVSVGTQEFEEIPAEYEDVEEEVGIKDLVDKGEFSVVVKPHFKKDYLLAVFAKDAGKLQDFLSTSGLKPIGNATDKDGNQTGGIKTLAHNVMSAVHKSHYESAKITKSKKVLKKAAEYVAKEGSKVSFSEYSKVGKAAGGKHSVFSVLHEPVGEPTGFAEAAVAHKHTLPANGLHVLFGHKMVRGSGGATLRKVADSSGKHHYELMFRLDHSLHKQISLSDLPKISDGIKEKTFGKDAGLYQEGAALSSVFGQYDEHHLSDSDLGSVFIASDDVKYAHKGKVRVRIPADNVSDESTVIDNARALLNNVQMNKSSGMSDLSEVMTEPSEESMTFFKLRKAMWSRVPHSEAANVDLNAHDAMDQMAELLIKHGCNLDKLETSHLNAGHTGVVEHGSWDRIKPYVKTMGYAGNKDHAASVLKYGILSPYARSTLGITSSGYLSDDDWQTGGASQVTVRVNQMGSSGGASNVNFILDPRLMERTDCRYYNGDMFGATNPQAPGHHGTAVKGHKAIDKQLAQATFPGNNEAILDHSIPPTAILGIAVDQHHYDDFISQMKNEGITSVNGVPIEDFVHKSGGISTHTKVTKAALGDDYHGN